MILLGKEADFFLSPLIYFRETCVTYTTILRRGKKGKEA
jgi:hypothetical protein